MKFLMLGKIMLNDKNSHSNKDLEWGESINKNNSKWQLPIAYCNRLQRQIEVIAQEIELIRDPNKFEHASIVITHILQSIASTTTEFNLKQLDSHQLSMAVMVNEWLASLHLPNEEELSAFTQHLGNLSLLVKALTAQVENSGNVYRDSLSNHDNSRRKKNLRTVVNNKVIGRIKPDERLGQYRLMVSTSQDMLAMIDCKYRYVIANPSYIKTFGNNLGDITGLTVPEVIGKKNFKQLVRPKFDKALSGEAIHFELCMLDINQETLYLDVTYEPYSNLKGDVTGIVVSARNITKRKKMEQALENSQNRFRTLCDLSPTGIFRNNKAGEAVYVNNETASCVGLEQGVCLNSGWTETLHPEDKEKVFNRWNNAVTKRLNFNQEYRFVHPNGKTVWVVCSAVPEFDSDGEYLGYIGTLVNITPQKLAEEKGQLAASVFENTQDGIIITDVDTNIISVNPAFEHITGYSAGEAIGKKLSFIHSKKQSEKFYQDMWQEINNRGFWRGELWNQRKNGSSFPQWLTISAVKNDSGQTLSYVSVFSDISAIKKSEQRLTWMAYHDPLTNLANRTLFSERLGHGIARASRDNTLLAVIFLDFDNFKHINDSMGHKTGDEFLIGVAKRLNGILRESDTLARFGGDEFTLLIENYKCLSEINNITQKITQSFKKPFIVDGNEIYISISMGISIFPNNGNDADTLLRNADSAMYRAKKSGGGCLNFYTSELTESARKRILVETGIRKAIKNNELQLHFQPQFDALNNELIGAEALVRWHSPDMGEMSPGLFIPIAEESSVINELGAWVMEEACKQTARWMKMNFNSFRIAVNISVRQIQQTDFVKQVMDILESTGLPGDKLELEVTEGVVLHAAETQCLRRLRERGISISIDDFGTGYSSLSYLRDLPVDRLKIDQSFVRDIGRNQRDEAIVRAVIAMGHAHGLEITAEGVEEFEQQEFLRNEGCNELQGYLLGKPMPANKFERQLANWISK